MNQVTRTGIVYDTVVLSTVSYALSGWGGYIRQALNDSIDASFWKAGRCHLTCTQYNVNDLLFGVDSKHFACCKSELYSLHHMLPLHSCSSQMTLCPHEAILMIYLEWYMIWESVPLFCCLCINRNQCYCSLCGQLLLSENFPINNCLLWTYCVITALWQRKKQFFRYHMKNSQLLPTPAEFSTVTPGEANSGPCGFLENVSLYTGRMSLRTPNKQNQNTEHSREMCRKEDIDNNMSNIATHSHTDRHHRLMVCNNLEKLTTI